MLAGKRQRDACERQQVSPAVRSLQHTITVATTKLHAAMITGMVGGKSVEIMLDSGSSISLLAHSIVPELHNILPVALPPIQLKTAAGEPLPIIDYIQTRVCIANMESSVQQNFVVVSSLIAPVILGLDFFQQHGLILDFTGGDIKIYAKRVPRSPPDYLQPLWEETQRNIPHIGTIAAIGNSATEPTEECAIPDFGASEQYELPIFTNSAFVSVVDQYKRLFRSIPGTTSVAVHNIPTKGSAIRVPPRRVPAHYRNEVERQIDHMLKQGVIEESSSPWMAPAVFIPKKSGELRICIDYRELNKLSIRDSYPLPLPDEVQDRLAGSKVFSTLDLHSGYWQLPVAPADREKTAFCPGPGMGLYQFCRMPFGLSGAPGSFQRLMDSILRGLPFVLTYIDDILIHSATEELHKEHLQQVFARLQDAGLTLRGKKCHIGVPQVYYLGNVFSEAGMQPDSGKIQAVREWPLPQNVTALKQFLGLASYYRRYVENFASIAAPLHMLTQKSVSFQWNQACDAAFSMLKGKLIESPVLTYPNFAADAGPFVLQTDASAVGIGAVLEQKGHVIAYFSRALTKAEKHYSVIQQECLAAVAAMKHFRHYLLGHQFTLMTDHAPLQWLSAQKMEGLLCHWALAMQEYNFSIVYRTGSSNGNAANQLTPVAVTSTRGITDSLQSEQQADPILQQVHKAVSASTDKPIDWHHSHQSPLHRYYQMWHQLSITDGVVCRTYKPDPNMDMVTVPLLPPAQRQRTLHMCHDVPSAGHQGIAKTLKRVKQEAYWVGMAKYVYSYCTNCLVCQKAKLPLPPRAPLVNTPIGKPWQMLAIDILEVPVSFKNNRYLLVIMDYFTKWAEAVPLPDQKAKSISNAIIKLCSSFGIPDVIHSDQGRNFESCLFQEMLTAFGIEKSRTTAYHPQGDGMVERFNRSLLQLLRCYTQQENDWEQYLPLVLYAYCTAPHSSTGISPFELMFGRPPKSTQLQPQTGFDPSSYSVQLQAKLAALQDLVRTNTTTAAQTQKFYYDRSSTSRAFTPQELVWLSIPTAGKLQPRWEGKWKVVEMKGPVTVEITDGRRTKVVHVNRVRHRNQPVEAPVASNTNRTFHTARNTYFRETLSSATKTSSRPVPIIAWDKLQ